MAYENVEMPAPNMTGDRTNSNFYCFYNGVLYSKQRGSPYSLINVYPVDTYVGTVVCTQFDGVYYWSMERQTGGFTIKKWEIVSGILKQRAIFSYTETPFFKLDTNCFALEYYSDTLDITGSTGASSITVVDGDLFNVGDTLILGPSTIGSFSGQYESVIVSSKAGNILYLSSPLVKSFSSGDDVYTTRYFYVFNKYSPNDTKKGALLKYRSGPGTLYSYSSSHMFGEVTAACFYDNRIMFIKGNEVVILNPASLNVYRHFAIDNLEADRGGIVPSYALWAYSDVVYRLQNKYVYYDVPTEEWLYESWGSTYSYVSSVFPTIFTSTVYFVEVRAYPPIIHSVATGIPTSTSQVVVTVLNQDRTPLSGRTVNMTSTYGTLVPNTGATDSDGKFECIYNGTSDITEVEIKATVT